MGRKRKNAVYGFFCYEKSVNKSTCLVPGCSMDIKGQHGTNLLYHLSSKHEDEYKIVQRRNELIANEEFNENNASIDPTNEHTNRKLEKLKQECTKLVTVHGRPFAMLEDEAFKNILKLTTLSQRDLQSINTHSIRESVQRAAMVKRKEISLELKDKLVCLKVDGATCQDRMFLGINAQYINDDIIIIRSLGVTELHARSTSDFLKEKLLHVLRKYDLSVDQIYSVTTDNGTNMIKMTRLLNDNISIDDDENDEDDDITIDRTAELEIILDDDNAGQYEITSIRCAAHTLQLAVNDAINEDDALHIIEDARLVARKLRTPTMKNILKAANKRKPILDVTTRWHSTLDMLERLLELRDFCSSTPQDNLYVSEVTWYALQDLVTSLTPAKILTKQLQSEQLTIGDFFYHWTKCHLDTAKVNVPLAQYICVYMDRRKEMLMQNNTFVTALFLDPRFQVVLSPEQINAAISHLSTVWAQILKVQAKSIEEPRAESSQDVVDLVEWGEDEIETVLAQTEQSRRNNARAMYIQSQANIVTLLDNFSRHPRLNSKENILQFWAKKKFSEPQLYRLAHTILATPATQVSVERLFSALKFVLSTLRYNLTDEIVEDILILRYN